MSLIVHYVNNGRVACQMDMPPSKWPEWHKWSSEWKDVTCPVCQEAQQLPITYELPENGQAFKCLRCGLTSHNENDVKNRYCGHCHAFHDDIWPPARAAWLKDLICPWCEEPVLRSDKKHVVPSLEHKELGPVDRTYHTECFFRTIAGSVGHQEQKCPCYGGTEEDPPELTRREAAKAALVYWRDHNKAGRVEHEYHKETS